MSQYPAYSRVEPVSRVNVREVPRGSFAMPPMMFAVPTFQGWSPNSVSSAPVNLVRRGLFEAPRRLSPEPIRLANPEPLRRLIHEPIRTPMPGISKRMSAEPLRIPSPEPVSRPSPEPVVLVDLCDLSEIETPIQPTIQPVKVPLLILPVARPSRPLEPKCRYCQVTTLNRTSHGLASSSRSTGRRFKI